MTKEISLIPKSPAEVAKAITYIAITALALLQTSLAGGLTLVEYLVLGIAVVTAIPVYLLAGTTVKTVVAFVSAALQALVLAIGDATNLADVSAADWITILFAALAAIGIALVPNKPMIDARGTNHITSLP